MKTLLKRHFNKKATFITLCFAYITLGFSQDLENIGSRTLENVKNSPLKVNGAVSTNGVYYNSNGRTTREPFTYFLQGNINISWLTFNMPLSYSFSNQGSNLDYQTPFKFNRLSLHPKYKWIQTHIGDVSMSFSPYTLNGFQFTGGGVELTPQGGFSISAMAGRLLKATEDDGNPQTLPAFKRMGYGTKLGWQQDTYKIGLIGFYAKDDINSISTIPDDRDITPKENLVIGLDGEVKIAEHYTLKAEYASTAITQDLRAEKSNTSEGVAGMLFNNTESTEYYKAYKAGIDMNIDNMKVGLAYERVDPGYETLGSYFFNNDFENITLNGSRPFFNNKLDLTFNIGYQRDNLENQKAQETSRFVGAVNATLKITEKIVLSGSYSNFTTHTNKSLNQFDDINDSDLTDEDLEALNFKQLSQNANVNINWLLVEKDNITQNLNVNYNLASSANEENGVIRVGQANNFHNANTVYTIGFPKNALNISTSLNYNYSDIGRDDSNAYGGALDINKKFFDNKLNATFGSTYNTNNNKETVTNVLNFRANAALTVAEHHNFNLSAIQLFRSVTNQDKLREITVTFGYVYTFDIGRPKFKERIKEDKEFSFSYRTHTFSGAHESISPEILNLINTPEFSTVKQLKDVVTHLSKLEKEIQAVENSSDNNYKNAALDYLRYLYKYKDYLDTYHKVVFNSLRRLYTDAIELDHIVSHEYKDALANVNTAKEKGKSISSLEMRNLQLKERKYNAHTWMQEQLSVLTWGDVLENRGLLNEFKNKYLSRVFTMLENGKTQNEVELYLEEHLADFYHKKSLKVKR